MPSALRGRCRIVDVEEPRPEYFPIVMRKVLREAALDCGVRVERRPRLDRAVVDAMRDGFACNGLAHELRDAAAHRRGHVAFVNGAQRAGISPVAPMPPPRQRAPREYAGTAVLHSHTRRCFALCQIVDL